VPARSSSAGVTTPPSSSTTSTSSSGPGLIERFRVETLPTLVVVEDKVVRGRLERPRGCREIEGFLAPGSSSK
jgi:hypothetical protein